MVDLKYSFERDWLFELFEKKLSGDKLASELALYEQDWVKIGGNAIVTLNHSFDDICGSPPLGGNSHKKSFVKLVFPRCHGYLLEGYVVNKSKDDQKALPLFLYPQVLRALQVLRSYPSKCITSS